MGLWFVSDSGGSRLGKLRVRARTYGSGLKQRDPIVVPRVMTHQYGHGCGLWLFKFRTLKPKATTLLRKCSAMEAFPNTDLPVSLPRKRVRAYPGLSVCL